MINARVEGSIRFSAETLNGNLPAALTAAAILLKDEAVHRAPGDTGTLRKSIDYKVTGKEAVVFSDQSHAPYVEMGSGPHVTDFEKDKFIENITDWAHRHGIENPWPLIKMIRKRGTAAKPFFRPALESKKVEMVQVFSKELSRDR